MGEWELKVQSEQTHAVLVCIEKHADSLAFGPRA